jgi:hypothetical protein
LTLGWYDGCRPALDRWKEDQVALVPEQKRYLSFLLRLWQTSSDGEQIWRASLESPGSETRQGFASLQDLFEFLETQTSPGTGTTYHKKEGDSNA